MTDLLEDLLAKIDEQDAFTDPTVAERFEGEIRWIVDIEPPEDNNGIIITMNVQPLYDRVLLQRIETEEQTDSGIIIPDSAEEMPQQGIVRATGEGSVGDDGEQIPLQVSEGDKILFSEDSGTEVVIGGENHVIVREGEILAVINE